MITIFQIKKNHWHNISTFIKIIMFSVETFNLNNNNIKSKKYLYLNL